jgi:hypothetical protein
MAAVTTLCTNCNRLIGTLESVHLWADQPVCAECYDRLSRGTQRADFAESARQHLSTCNHSYSGWKCANCGIHGKPKTYTKGTFGIELLLWLCGVLPGLAYSIWRLASSYKGCPICEAPHMIPANTSKTSIQQLQHSGSSGAE